MEQMKFTADDIVTDDHDGLIEVSFGAPKGMFFQLARLSEKCCQNEGIVDRGMADIYIVINDQGQAAYGGIRECLLTNTRFFAKFDSHSSSELQTDSVDISFDASDVVFKKMRDALHSIFRNISVFVDETDLKGHGLASSRT